MYQYFNISIFRCINISMYQYFNIPIFQNITGISIHQYINTSTENSSASSPPLHTAPEHLGSHPRDRRPGAAGSPLAMRGLQPSIGRIDPGVHERLARRRPIESPGAQQRATTAKQCPILPPHHETRGDIFCQTEKGVALSPRLPSVSPSLGRPSRRISPASGGTRDLRFV